MPQWIEWILYILLVIIMLGVLIAIHEAGHLAMAKAFNVYCFEYSVGMGPKILSKKRKNGETYFSWRAVPFGGFVSMYGEPGAVPDGFEEPDASRSLESIAKWKKAIILVAGVTLNFALGLVLIYIGDAACPMFYAGRVGVVNEDGSHRSVVIDTTYRNDVLSYIDANKPSDTYEAKDYVVSMPLYNDKEGNTLELLAWNVHIYNAEGVRINTLDYVLCYSPTTVISEHGLGDSVMLFPASSAAVDPKLQEFGVTMLPEIYDANKNINAYDFSKMVDGIYINVPLTLVPREKAKDMSAYASEKLVCADEAIFRLTLKDGKLTGDIVTVNVIKDWPTFAEGWKRWSEDVPNACGALVKGFASLFTPNGWKNMSSIVGITAAMPQINAAGGARMILYFAGLISINLAFFNLLPFPGLDGWQLLVTAIEAISRKKVPAKVQGIVSLIGMILLFGLMLVIVVKDVVGLFVGG